MGLVNSMATFQQNKDMITAGLAWKICVCYVNNMWVYSKTLEQHLNDIVMVLECYLKYNFKLKPIKCKFAIDSKKIHY